MKAVARVTRSIAELLAAMPLLERAGSDAGTVSAAVYASKEVTPGACFVAIRVRSADGHPFIPEALARGTTLIVGKQQLPWDDRRVARAELAKLGYMAAGEEATAAQQWTWRTEGVGKAQRKS
jgi:UDP-N-acetylmuramyl tripeptide synthase